ncbi:MAG: hypothetical protein ACR2GO_05310 [Candidatus Limnocylindria bacterium]
MTETLEQLVEQARSAPPNQRIELRDPIAAHGTAAVDAMAEWLADPQLTRFAVRVIGRVADLGERDAALSTLRMAFDEATPDQRADIDAELQRLGFTARAPRGRQAATGPRQTVDHSTPGWMMRTDRNNAEWLWSEVQAGGLRQGWGYAPAQELTLLRNRRERGEPMTRDDDWAWPNRRMLSDEPDGMQIGDLVLLPHLPREWRWSVVRLTGPYRFEISSQHNDYGHILPAEVMVVDLGDGDLTPELRWMRTYPARLRRLTRQAYEDLEALLN